MRVVNESGMSVGWCVGQVPPHKLSATLIVKGTFRLRHGAAATLAPKQQGLDGDVLEDGALRYPSDFAWHKPKADFLLAGTCHAPGGRPTTVCRVTFQVGSWMKQLAVVGDRVHTRRFYFFESISDPLPFRTMKLSYRFSYGGARYPLNPVGRGHDETRLPNIYDPENVYIDADTRPEPAGFGALELTSPHRKSKAGSYDRAWLKGGWPGLPADADWTMYNAAPEDQQVPAYLAGGESLHFEHLHPTIPVYTSELPGLRARWLLRTREAIREVPLRLDTLWVDMDAESLVLVWRGVTPVAHPKMREILDHLIVSEPVGAPKSLEQYAPLLERAKPAEVPDLPRLQFADPELPSMDWRKAFDENMAAMTKEADARKVEALRKLKEGSGGLERFGFALPTPESPAPDLLSFHDRIAGAYEMAKKLRPEIASKLPPPPTLAELRTGIEKPVKPVEPIPEPVRREKAADFTGRDFSGQNLAGRDFRGAVLAKANLRNANLEGADFSDAILAGGDLSGAKMAKAKFLRADLAKASLAGADLSEATLERADLSGADLRKAVLTKASMRSATLTGADLGEASGREADLSGADLQKAKLARADFTSGRLPAASLEGAKAEGLVLRQADLTKLRASGAEMPGADLRAARGTQSIWQGAKLDGANFSEAELTRASFTECSLPKARFSLADLRSARFLEADLSGADLLKVNLFRGSLEGAILTGADVRGSNLYGVEFLNAKIEGAAFENSDLTGTKLEAR